MLERSSFYREARGEMRSIDGRGETSTIASPAIGSDIIASRSSHGEAWSLSPIGGAMRYGWLVGMLPAVWFAALVAGWAVR